MALQHGRRMKTMKTISKAIVLGLALILCAGAAAWCEEPPEAELKGLDEQVQEVKGDVIDIAAELNLLEEKLLYPSQTQVAVFVSVAEGESFRLDSIDMSLGEEGVAHHLYSYKELEALKKGGVQRLYTGNVTTGAHPMTVSFNGVAEGGTEFSQTGSYQVDKGVGPKIVEIKLARQAITFADR